MHTIPQVRGGKLKRAVIDGCRTAIIDVLPRAFDGKIDVAGARKISKRWNKCFRNIEWEVGGGNTRREWPPRGPSAIGFVRWATCEGDGHRDAVDRCPQFTFSDSGGDRAGAPTIRLDIGRMHHHCSPKYLIP